MVRGEKRDLRLSTDDEDDTSETNKMRISLNISGTCELINNIELAQVVNESLAVSDATSQNRDVSSEGDGLVFPFSDEEGNIASEHEVRDGYESQDGAVGGERVHWPEYDSLSEVDSIPPLASTESETTADNTHDHGQSTDSGMLEESAGNVTNLCRNREPANVQTGVVTETGPLIPVSLGFSDIEEDDGDWEEVLDDQGYPTGMERRSFKLNVVSGDTESIDEDWDRVRRVNGLFDGTNARREVNELGERLYETSGSETSGQVANLSVYSESSDVSGEGYHAESSDSTSESASEQAVVSGCLDRTRTTLSAMTSGTSQLSRCLGGARTTLSDPDDGTSYHVTE